MSESSPGWNVDYEIIPGAHRLRGLVQNITRRVCFLPDSVGYPSEYPKHPERLSDQQIGHAVMTGAMTAEEAFGVSATGAEAMLYEHLESD